MFFFVYLSLCILRQFTYYQLIFCFFLFCFLGVAYPWRWSRTHRSSGDLGCDACPHTKIFESRAMRVDAPLGRQPNSVPFVLGGPRWPVVPCNYSGSCRTHPGSVSVGEAVVSPSRMVRVRGNPPSGFIPQPYMSSTGGRSSLYAPPAPATHDALVFLLGNVMNVFSAYEACLEEVDAWRRYFCSGQ